jgi:hypothetical protein
MALMRELPSARGAIDASLRRKNPSKRAVWTPAFTSFGSCKAMLPSQQLHFGASVGQGGKAARQRLMVEGEDLPIDRLAKNEGSRWQARTS